MINDPAWKSDPISHREQGEVDRFKLPQDRLPKLSFSGSERNHLFAQTGDNRFVDISGISGLDSIDDGRSIAVFDFDHDGFQEFLLTNANNQTLNLFHSRVGRLTTDRKVLAIRLVGGNSSKSTSQEFSARDAIGAKITVSAAAKNILRELHCGEGLAAQNSSTLLFGLRDARQVDSVKVEWPSGNIQEFADIQAPALLTIFENEAESSDGKGIEVAEYRPVQWNGALAKTISPNLSLGCIPDNGKWTLITAMATWCENCREHLPEIARIRRQIGNELEVYAIPVDPDDSAEKLADYIARYQPEYKLLPADEGERRAFLEFAVQHLGDGLVPFSVIVEPGGQAELIAHGLPSLSELIEKVRPKPGP